MTTDFAAEYITNQPFEIELARSGRVLAVGADEGILDVLRAAGVAVVVSCEQGICGACETRVLAGVVDHRCQVLSEEERAEGRLMMICCGRAKTPRLVLDI